MARVTIDDCLQHIPNQFEMILTATKRARELANGAESHIDRDDDKPTVLALREIAAGFFNLDEESNMSKDFNDEPEIELEIIPTE